MTTMLVHLLVKEQPISTTTVAWYNYGTTGFRFPAHYIEGLMIHVGVLSILL